MKRNFAGPPTGLNYEDRDLCQQRQAGAERIDVVLGVELHHLLVEALLVVLVLGLQVLDLGRQVAQRLHGAELLDGEREKDDPHHDGQGDDRKAPAEPQSVEEGDDRIENRDQGTEDGLDRVIEGGG